jgi:predicted CoA-substrate-specific enzyme activase
MKQNIIPNIIFGLGIDIGSTTAKIVAVDENNQIIHSDYRRHNTKIYNTLLEIITELPENLNNSLFSIQITGSAGMGVSENIQIPFVQEVVAATEYISKNFPEVKTLIDIGGEDSKMIFLSENRTPDIRMNGSCAGGTGAFIDQTASLLDVSLEEFNELAKNYKKIHPIASRCGVFAKTDIQNLLSRKISKEDIAASVFHAVAIQTINTLARGFDIIPKIMFSGGPFTFLSELTKTFYRDLKISPEEIVISQNPALLSAFGAAIYENKSSVLTIDELKTKIREAIDKKFKLDDRLEPLFKSNSEFERWKNQQISTFVPKKTLTEYCGSVCFLGIDSGSTTTKLSVIGENHELLFSFYANNHGQPIETTISGLSEFYENLKNSGKSDIIKIARTAITGYGEDLLKAALHIDIGIVETIAHFEGAKYFNKNVSFILDIGGQDMKAIFVENGSISRIELNESCSAGCGSFIETFGKNLGFPVSDFALLACKSSAPCDLGTRCTVFMNSKVKQSLRENADTSDIAAGLSISVIKNALFKVLKLKNISVLGNNISVQGGAFKNLSLLRAMETLSEKKVVCTDIPEQMGAFGAACTAFTEYYKSENKPETHFIGLENLNNALNFSIKQVTCRGCENVCLISRFNFTNNQNFYSGNKCEKIFSSTGNLQERGQNLIHEKYQLVFERKSESDVNTKLPVIGIPRVLNIFENYPFWHKLFSECGFSVILSTTSTTELYEKGKGAIMSDSICFPAKIAHGHIEDLIQRKADRIFYPTVIYEKNEFEGSENSYNCPIVSSYSQVIISSMSSEKREIPVDSPTVNFDDNELLEKACYNYFKTFKIGKKTFKKAYSEAVSEAQKVRDEIRKRADKLISDSIAENRMLIVLAGRPYHIDPLINQKVPDILADMGCNVISEDMAPFAEKTGISDLQIIPQWAYPNRIYNAAQWVAEMPENIQFIQINSFGCGPDSIVTDETVQILKSAGKNQTLIRVDDITASGSVKLRLRSMIESLRLKDNSITKFRTERAKTAVFGENEKQRTILAPFFADIYSDLIPALFKRAGYNMINLPKPDKSTKQFGLKYANNEICYPATLVVGDVIKALAEGNYNHNEIAVGITQTGGQCRASTYLSLIKKAMIDSGFEDIPVIAVGTAGKTINPQPGFEVNWKKLLPITFVSMIYADVLAKMYYSTVVREKQKGDSKKTLEIYLKRADKFILEGDTKSIYKLIDSAVEDFNKIPIHEGFYPKVGIVGEIYIKYNSFGHSHIIDWLIDNGIEVVVPPILDFFVQEFVNIEISKKSNLKKTEISPIYLYFIEKSAERLINRANRKMSKFRFFEPFRKIRNLADDASKVIHLANQFGEGWLIAAEIIDFAKHGINNAVSVQPFGCIANQIISKGIEKKIKQLYPNLNLLFLDFDDGTTEVNILNRLHFMANHVKNEKFKIKG